jgi:RNA polymerase sigma factor (sigma-70 family)
MAKQKKISQAENPLLAAYSDLIGEQRFAKHRSGETEDIGQDASLRVLAIEDASSIRAPKRYLMRIIRNIFVDRQRRRGREAALHKSLELAESGQNDQLDPERIVSARQELERVTIAISVLPPRCRQAFVLHRLEHLSYSAIARRMCISSGTVEKHIAEAMSRIARAVNQADEDRR